MNCLWLYLNVLWLANLVDWLACFTVLEYVSLYHPIISNNSKFVKVDSSQKGTIDQYLQRILISCRARYTTYKNVNLIAIAFITDTYNTVFNISWTLFTTSGHIFLLINLVCVHISMNWKKYNYTFSITLDAESLKYTGNLPRVTDLRKIVSIILKFFAVIFDAMRTLLTELASSLSAVQGTLVLSSTFWEQKIGHNRGLWMFWREYYVVLGSYSLYSRTHSNVRVLLGSQGWTLAVNKCNRFSWKLICYKTADGLIAWWKTGFCCCCFF